MTTLPRICTMTPAEIEATIQSYLPIRREKKDLQGEVFTPVFLIDDMLDKIPAHIWRNPELTWLDPAAGIGSYSMRIFSRLMDRLPDRVKGRYANAPAKARHILRHMLFMVELDAANVRVAKRLFGSEAHICRADFLKERDQWSAAFGGRTQFDVIVGNPPFNAPQTNAGKKGGGDSLWPAFVRTSLSIMKHVLAFVHPSTWRKPQVDGAKTDDLYEQMTRDHFMAYLEIHSKADGVRTFGIETRYDWYIIQKKRPSDDKKTVVKDEQGETHAMDLRGWPFFPNSHYAEIRELLGKSDGVIYSRTQFGTDKPWTHATQTAAYPWPLIHSTPKSGVRYYWTSTKTPEVTSPVPMFGVPKVIFGESGTTVQHVVVDASGKYGLTQEAIGLRIRSAKEGRLIKEALLSERFQTILQAMSFSQYRIDWRMFAHFKPTFYTHFLKPNRRPSKPNTKPSNNRTKKRGTDQKRRNGSRKN